MLSDLKPVLESPIRCAMPTHDSVWLDNRQVASPVQEDSR